MMTELPEKFETARGLLRYSVMNTSQEKASFGKAGRNH